MFDKEIRAEIRSARVKVREDGAFKARTIRMALERELDDEMAAALGPDGRLALEGLRKGGMTKAVLPIEAVVAGAVVDGKERLRIDRMTGVKATCSVGKAKEDEGTPLKVKLEFDFPFHKQMWTMLGEEAGDFISLTLTRRQLDLPGTVAKETKAEAHRLEAPPPAAAANGHANSKAWTKELRPKKDPPAKARPAGIPPPKKFRTTGQEPQR